MKRLMMTNKIAGFFIGFAIALILFLALPLQGCKSVRKSQNEKFESATVKKSDSSSSKSYSYIDTTKTDSSTEITKTEVTIDSVEYDYVPQATWINSYDSTVKQEVNPVFVSWIKAPSRPSKAKGVKITTTTIKQAAIKAKGVTVKEDTKQADIKTDSGFAKRELSKETVKKPSIYMGMGLVFGVAILIGLIWVIIWVWRKKKAAAKAAIEAAGKIF